MTETRPLHRTIVRVTDLPLLADIDISPDEIGRRQLLMVSVELALERGLAGVKFQARKDHPLRRAKSLSKVFNSRELK